MVLHGNDGQVRAHKCLDGRYWSKVETQECGKRQSNYSLYMANLLLTFSLWWATLSVFHDNQASVYENHSSVGHSQLLSSSWLHRGPYRKLHFFVSSDAMSWVGSVVGPAGGLKSWGTWFLIAAQSLYSPRDLSAAQSSYRAHTSHARAPTDHGRKACKSSNFDEVILSLHMAIFAVLTITLYAVKRQCRWFSPWSPGAHLQYHLVLHRSWQGEPP